jgi:hypothetical protein
MVEPANFVPTDLRREDRSFAANAAGAVIGG